jgi:hypothetical protein
MVGKCQINDGKIIALFIALLAIFIEELINDPDTTGVVGNWIAALGDILSSLAGTKSLINKEKENQKNLLRKQINELQNKLNDM